MHCFFFFSGSLFLLPGAGSHCSLQTSVGCMEPDGARRTPGADAVRHRSLPSPGHIHAALTPRGATLLITNAHVTRYLFLTSLTPRCTWMTSMRMGWMQKRQMPTPAKSGPRAAVWATRLSPLVLTHTQRTVTLSPNHEAQPTVTAATASRTLTLHAATAQPVCASIPPIIIHCAWVCAPEANLSIAGVRVP